jgi:hypothetical protein
VVLIYRTWAVWGRDSKYFRGAFVILNVFAIPVVYFSYKGLAHTKCKSVTHLWRESTMGRYVQFFPSRPKPIPALTSLLDNEQSYLNTVCRLYCGRHFGIWCVSDILSRNNLIIILINKVILGLTIYKVGQICAFDVH